MQVCKLILSLMLLLSLTACVFTPSREREETYGTGAVDQTAPADTGISLESDSAGTVLDYFSEIAFGSEYGQSSGKLCRWGTEIIYKVTGEPTDGDIELIGILADRLNGIEGFPGIREAGFGETANFEVMFITRDEIMEEFSDATEACVGMSEYRWYTDSCEIFRAKAAIDREESAERASTVCEEFLQALGLAMDSYSHADSVFYQGKCVYQRPSELDWALVELLYHPNLRAGMDKTEAITAAAGVLAW